MISLPLNLILVFLFNGSVLKSRGRIKKKILAIGKERFDYNLERGVALKRIASEDILQLFKDKEIDEIIICERIKDGEKLNFLLFFSQLLKINIVFSPQLYSELVADKIYSDIPLEYISTFVGRKSDWEEFIIRLFDVAASFITLFFALPLILLVAVLIKVSSFGKIFYRQERVGKDGKTFILYKFRTMVSDAELKHGPVLAIRNDPRVTKIGRFLRFSRIDEIPQFFNVIRGDMSLVGPRPERMHFVKMHDALQGIRLAVKPGLTGIAQIRSFYDLKPNHKQKYDYFYIQKRSLALNLYIIFKTIFVVADRRKGW
jgi:lipopolysaccharide/colanic/teichoic acid biosynthesis glycosyltransferase